VEHGNSGGDENDATAAVDMDAAATLSYPPAIDKQHLPQVE
jgi:hypothetical protein